MCRAVRVGLGRAGHISRQTGINFGDTHLGVKKNLYSKFRQNYSTDYGESEISKKADGGHIC